MLRQRSHRRWNAPCLSRAALPHREGSYAYGRLFRGSRERLYLGLSCRFSLVVPVDVNTHRTRATDNGTHRSFDGACAQIGGLNFRDTAELGLAEASHLLEVGDSGAFLLLDLLLDQVGSRRRLEDEREGAVAVDGDDDRDDHPSLICSCGVERLAELHQVDAVLTKCGADWRRRSCLRCLQLQLDDTY